MIASLRAPRSRGAGSRRSFYGTAGGFRPERLGLRAVYDYRLADATGFYDQSGNGLPQATVGGGSNSPLWLPYVAPQIYLPNGAANQIYSGGAVAFTSTSVLRIETRQAVSANWNASGQVNLGSIGGGISPMLLFLQSGAIQVGFTLASGGVFQSVASPWTDAGFHTVAVEVDPVAGTCRFFNGDSGSWVQLGATLTFTPSTWAATSPQQALLLGTAATDNYVSYIRFLADGSQRAMFDAAASSQAGLVDAQGNTWSLLRAASGRRTVAQSPQAASGKGLFLLGPDDKIDISSTALPTFGTSGTGTIFIVVRTWQATGTQYFCGNQTGGSRPGYFLSKATSTATASIADVASGNGGGSAGWPSPQSVRVLLGFRVSATQVTVFANGAYTAPTARPPAAFDSASQFIIGGYVGPLSGASDFELEAWGSSDSELSNAALAQIGAFYGVGL